MWSSPADAAHDDCGCYTSGGIAYGVVEGHAPLKQWLIDSIAQYPETDERYHACQRVLERFHELDAFYEDETLTPDERWVKVNDRMTALMWPTDTNDAPPLTRN